MTRTVTASVGAWTVTTLWDGDFPAGPGFVSGADPAEIEAVFLGAGLPPMGPSPEPINAFALERHGELWLVDAGLGSEVAPGFGRVPGSLRDLGVEPADVGRIVLTHLHEDHVGGLVAKGSKVFPNARLFVPDKDYRFWTDPDAPAWAPTPPGNFDLARKVLELYAGQVERIADGGTIAPGLSYRFLPGHTPGHSGIVVEDEGERLLMWADITHSNLIQLTHPEWGVGFDVDKAAALTTRMALLSELSRSGLKVMGSHMTGVGRVRSKGDGYAFLPDVTPEPIGRREPDRRSGARG